PSAFSFRPRSRWLVAGPVLVLFASSGGALAAPRGLPGGEGEPLWTEMRRPERGEPVAPASLPSFAKLARTVGPAVVNIATLQREEGPPGALLSRPRTRGQ